VTTEPPAISPVGPSFPTDLGSIRSMIEYRFTLLDAYIDINGLPTFLVAQEPVKEKFRELLRDLANHNLSAKIRRVSEKLAISVFPKPNLGKPRKKINLVLFLATIGTVAAASYYLLVFIVDPRLIVAPFATLSLTWQIMIFAIAVLGIVGIHELGHVVAVRRHRMDASLPYFLPVPPPFPFGTFGAVISLRGSPVNRDQLFDLGFSGPLAGFLATLGVAIFVILTAPIVTQGEIAQLVAAKVLQSTAWPNDPLFLDLLGQIGLRTVPAGHVIVYTQLMFAAEFGALITFLNLMPVWQLDGGHISRAVFGDKGHKIFALVAFGILLLAQYWGFAILLIVLMFLSRRPLEGLEPLDDISPLSNTRKVLFVLSLCILVLSSFILL